MKVFYIVFSARDKDGISHILSAIVSVEDYLEVENQIKLDLHIQFKFEHLISYSEISTNETKSLILY